MDQLTHKKQQILLAEGALLIVAMLEGLFPILIHEAMGVLPPFFYVSMGMLMAIAVLAPFVLRNGEIWHLDAETIRNIVLVAFFVMVFPIPFIFIGTQMTSGINTALLMQSEMLATFFLCTVILRDPLTKMHSIGAAIIFSGTILILWNGSMSLNMGDVLIIIGACLFPIGNIFAKKALRKVSPATIIFGRYVVAVSVLLPLSFILEDVGSVEFSGKFLGRILIYGVLILVCSKMFWYTGLRIINISKATFIICAFPAFSLVFAYFLLHEVPTLYQFMGLGLTLGGVWLLRGGEDIEELEKVGIVKSGE